MGVFFFSFPFTLFFFLKHILLAGMSNVVLFYFYYYYYFQHSSEEATGTVFFFFFSWHLVYDADGHDASEGTCLRDTRFEPIRRLPVFAMTVAFHYKCHDVAAHYCAVP